MRLDRFTAKFQQALADAQSLAVGRDNQFIEPIHILSALIAQEDGSVRPLLTLAGSDPKAVSLLLKEAIEKLPQVEGVGGDIQLSQQSAKVLNLCDPIFVCLNNILLTERFKNIFQYRLYYRKNRYKCFNKCECKEGSCKFG